MAKPAHGEINTCKPWADRLVQLSFDGDAGMDLQDRAHFARGCKHQHRRYMSAFGAAEDKSLGNAFKVLAMCNFELPVSTCV